MDPQRPLSGLFNLDMSCAGYTVWYGYPPPSITPLPFDGVPLHQTLGQLPDKANLVALTATLLGVNSEMSKFIPVAHHVQDMVPDL